jgi:hypothetical protein
MTLEAWIEARQGWACGLRERLGNLTQKPSVPKHEEITMSPIEQLRALGISWTKVPTGPMPVMVPERDVDGQSVQWCWNTYVALQREQLPWLTKRPGGADIPTMTQAQLKVARELWAARLSSKVSFSQQESDRRERARVSVDDDRWDV